MGYFVLAKSSWIFRVQRKNVVNDRRILASGILQIMQFEMCGCYIENQYIRFANAILVRRFG